MRRKTGRNILRMIPGLLLWALISMLFWSWIFNGLTDTDRARKITLFAGTHVPEDHALAVLLEEELPKGIRMVQVHSFDYALMDSASLETADLYVMTEAQAREHADWLCPLPTAIDVSRGTLVLEGETAGVFFGRTGTHSESAGSSPDPPASSFASLFHLEEAPGEAWYLCFGRGGYHLRSLENGVDDAVLPVALRLLEAP